MTIESASRLLVSSMYDLYDEREASSISSMVMEKLTGISKSLRFLHKSHLLSREQELLFERYLSDLLIGRPVQYVLQEAWFGAYPFFVNENVLVPRPETEELADWLLQEYPQANLSVLDIGTGRGCISVYIKKKQENFRVSALDVSQDALNIAIRNSRINHAIIDFYLVDILDAEHWRDIPVTLDLTSPISNPPYIPEKEKSFLDLHVREFEPSLALFVPDDNPLLFYRAIAEFAKQRLNRGGKKYF